MDCVNHSSEAKREEFPKTMNFVEQILFPTIFSPKFHLVDYFLWMTCPTKLFVDERLIKTLVKPLDRSSTNHFQAKFCCFILGQQSLFIFLQLFFSLTPKSPNTANPLPLALTLAMSLPLSPRLQLSNLTKVQYPHLFRIKFLYIRNYLLWIHLIYMSKFVIYLRIICGEGVEKIEEVGEARGGRGGMGLEGWGRRVWGAGVGDGERNMVGRVQGRDRRCCFWKYYKSFRNIRSF